MANSRSALKRVRSSESKRQVNHQRLSRIRTFVRKTKDAVASGDKVLSAKNFAIAQVELDRGAGKGIMSRSKVSRQVSALNRMVKELALAEAKE